MTTVKIQDLKLGDYFMPYGVGVQNKYEFQGQPEPGIYTGECNGDLLELKRDTLVHKLDGYALYLLQGGRDWD